jgi:hypothetical protein
MENKYFCPMTMDIRLLPCFTPPTKEVLLGKVAAIAK